MLRALKHSAVAAGRSLGLSLAGALCLGVGAGFLTVSAWLVLSLAYGAPMAGLILGAAYCGLGLILMALAGRRAPARNAPHRAARDIPADAPPLMQAFLHGMQAGASAGPHRRH